MSFDDIDTGSRNGVLLSHINVRSLNNETFDTFKAQFSDKNFMAIGLSETWLNEKDPSGLKSLAGYNMFRQDRNWGDGKTGGGLALYVKDSIIVNDTNYAHLNRNSECIEIQWHELVYEKYKNLVIANVYRPPSGKLPEFVDALFKLIGEANLVRKNLVVMGDYNLNYLDHREISTKKFKELAGTSGLTQIIRKPTRTDGKTSTCIDLILTNVTNLAQYGVIDVNLSDHSAVYLRIKKIYIASSKSSFMGRSYRHYHPVQFRQNLVDLDWQDFNECGNVDDQWNIFISKITSELDKMCPIKEFRVKNDRDPWISDYILECIKDKDCALKRAKRTKSDEDWVAARRLRNDVTKLVRNARAKYIKDGLEVDKQDSQKFWKKVNSVVKGSKNGSQVLMLVDEVSELEVPRENTADYINEFFINVGPKLAEGYNKEWSYDGIPRVVETGHILQTDVEEVVGLIKGMDISKSSCIENISSKALKDALLAIPLKVTEMFNLSFSSGKVPDVWKIGNIVPLPKEGDKSKVSNLRPITLLPVIGKLLEKVVNKRLKDYLEGQHLLDVNQGGFRQGQSTTNTVAKFINEVYTGCNERHYTLSTFVDLKKAFDTVNHSILIKKLGLLGIGGLLLNWLIDYLHNRKQTTTANGIVSKIGSVVCGVPQGSILGPTLFLVYINDLRYVIKNCASYLYADDTVITNTGPDLNLLTVQQEADLVRLDLWLQKNKLTLNAKKTYYMIFGMRSSLKQIVNHSLVFGNARIERALHFKYLGVILDPVLNFNMQAEQAIKKMAHKTYLMAKIRVYLPAEVMLMLYKAMVLPYADYGDIFYDIANQGVLNRMQVVQNRALRMALGVNHRYPTILVHQNAAISSLKPRRVSHLRNFMFKQQSNLDIVNVRLVNTRAHDATVFTTLRPKNETYKRNVYYRGAITWNQLSVDVRNTADFQNFKLQQKRWLSATNYM